MSVTVEWANPDHTIIYYRVTSPWNWEDYYSATDQSQEMMATVAHKVDFIVDLTGTTLLPANAMSHLKRRANQPNAKKGLGVMVGTSTFMKMMIDMMARLFPFVQSNVWTAATLEEAYAIIAEAQKRRVSSTT